MRNSLTAANESMVQFKFMYRFPSRASNCLTLKWFLERLKTLKWFLVKMLDGYTVSIWKQWDLNENWFGILDHIKQRNHKPINLLSEVDGTSFGFRTKIEKRSRYELRISGISIETRFSFTVQEYYVVFNAFTINPFVFLATLKQRWGSVPVFLVTKLNLELRYDPKSISYKLPYDVLVCVCMKSTKTS